MSHIHIRILTPALFFLQVDKKIVRTEIGVLLRLSHPNIVGLDVNGNIQDYAGCKSLFLRMMIYREENALNIRALEVYAKSHY